MNALAAPTPAYRALMVYDRLPAGCIAFLCTDAYSEPHIRSGEWVIVDTTDTIPRNGEVYVIEWMGGRRNICQAHRRPSRCINAAPGAQQWLVGGLSNPRGRAAMEAALAAYVGGDAPMQSGGWSEGPYADDCEYLASKLVGCVIGLYEPKAEGPVRQIGGDL
ncbi:MAG: hypothetical protein AB7P20_26150 [Rhizobiaceae bacterium]